MASKRALYKPVTQECTSQREKRKVLPQGRLVSKVDSAETSKEPRAALLSATNPVIPAARGVTSNNAVMSHMALSSKIHSGTSSAAVLAENNVTPRKKPPVVLNEDSPKQVSPTHSLDLSDAEVEGQPTSAATAAEVLVVDASRQLKSLDDTEVDIAVHLSQSQAKVICHTPDKAQSAFSRTSGSIMEAAKVSVDKVPSLRIPDLEAEPSSQPVTAPTIKQPLVVRESGLPAAAVPHFRALMAMTDHKSSSFESDQASSDSSRGDLEQPVAPLPERGDKIRINNGSAKTKCVTIDEDISIKIQAKKKAPKVVASRYMQSARGPVKADRSVLPDAYNSRLNSTHAVCGDATLVTKGRPGGGLKRSSSDTKMKLVSLNTTPDPRPNFGGQSSTPNVTCASGDTSLFLPATADISVIGPLPALDVSGVDRSVWHKHRSSSHILDAGGDSTGNRSGSTRDCVLKNLRPRGGADVSQWDLELLYGRVIQWAFLESKARKCLRDQEKQATNQLYDLFELTERQRRCKADLELQLSKLRHNNALDEALELQNAGLSGPVSRLVQLRGQYHHLAEALDTTRHHIPTKGLYFPRDRKEEYLDELARALQESEQLLGEISVMTRKQAPSVDQSAKLLGATEMTVERLVTELSRLQVLLTSFNSLLTQENALRVQQIYDELPSA